ncbi:MAG: hypothetical protein KDN05_02540 [Verrucomicrobiae bacterium]|nr:hypothetical protein [Verrucomicrobiae bacterium]
MTRALRAGMWWLATALTLPATNLSWFCNAGTTNLASTGAAMDGAFVFEVGVFSDGFVPTVSNLIEWQDHWVPAQQTNYNPANQRFASVHVVTANSAPFTAGATGWIFGRKTGAASVEWILFRSSSWSWPEPDPFSPFVLEWNAADADQIVLGTVNASGSPFLMRSAEVRSFDQWRGTELAGEPLDGPNDDPDHDGRPNAFEFAFGTSPLIPDASQPAAIDFDAGHARVTVPRLAGRPVHLWVEVSENLTTWSSGPPHLETVVETSASLVVRDPIAAGPLRPRAFYRVRVELP